MPLAELHGKLPGEVRRSEDGLTGSVFNLLTLLPGERGLLPWLNPIPLFWAHWWKPWHKR